VTLRVAGRPLYNLQRLVLMPGPAVQFLTPMELEDCSNLDDAQHFVNGFDEAHAVIVETGRRGLLR